MGDLKYRCPRFVQNVDVTIVDRWGKQVYSYSSGGENSIYIDWDGHDQNGKELSAGIYFYSARVTFETLDPKDSEKIIKGWVHLVKPE
jgi:flagellar hook assembly protein FlgD